MKRFINISLTAIITISLLLSGVFGAAAQVRAAGNPPPVQVYYVTLPESDGLRVLDAINSAADTPMYTYFSIAIAVDGTYIYYDQKENGYVADIANPSGAEIYSASNIAGVQIWGNGKAADGCAPNINGVPFACTDANDVLKAGNVIIPYNAVPLTGYLDYYVRDTFNSQSYGNNNGNTNWKTNWVENGDDGSYASGKILITSNALRFRYDGGFTAGISIDRGVDLSAGCATLTFTLGQNNIDANEDNFSVRISKDGVNYTVLDTFTSSDAAGSKSYDISDYATANTRVRFYADMALESNEYWTVDNVQVTWGCPVRDYQVILFDGRDKIAASNSIAMSRITWADGSGTLNAFGHEMYSTSEWGTYYEAPVGTNTANAGQMFEYSALSIMASQNNTTVEIDADHDGVYEKTVTLQQGGSYLEQAIKQGARVRSDKPVQVLLVTGDIGSTYASRDMNLLPMDVWGSSYWSPVGTVYLSNNTRLFLYNPGPGATYFTCEKYGAANVTSGSIAAGGVWTTDLTNGQGAHCYASTAAGVKTDQKISAIGTVDTTGTAIDWSFTMYPDNFLTTEALAGLGLGKDPTNTSSTENAGPLWVTSACETGGTYVYVDWNNDGVPDPVDTNGDGVNESGSENGIFVNRLQSVRLYKANTSTDPFDQSGARVWSRTAAGVGHGGTPGCLLALAWGADPARATAGAPGLDVGTSIPPLRLIEGSKVLEITNDTQPLGVLNPGDTIVYKITVKNSGSSVVTNVRVWDTAPANTQYVAGTTRYRLDSGAWSSIPDGSGGTLPLHVAGGVLLGNLPVGSTYHVEFQATLLDGDYEDITNCEETYTSGGNLDRCVTTPVATLDWGDLPNTYETTADVNGPRHSYNGLVLGSLWDREADGQEDASALGDDITFLDDEDGVTSPLNYQSWETGDGGFNVVVSTFGNQTTNSACLNGWMDFTNGTTAGAMDGDFYDTYGSYSEHIINNVKVTVGTNSVPVIVPAGMPFKDKFYYFRFRLTPVDKNGQCTAVIPPTGFQAGGEVEDYMFTWGQPTAVTLVDFSAVVTEEGSVQVNWTTVSERDNLGFNLYRSESQDGERVKLNERLIRSGAPIGGASGAVYQFVDPSAPIAGQQVFYWLEDIDLRGGTGLHGPVIVQGAAE